MSAMLREAGLLKELAEANGRIRQLEAERVPDGHIVVKAKWVERNSGLGDHACARCYQHSDMIVDGFTCYYHQAVDMLAAAPAQEKV